jgi:hypothetical protein
MIFWNPNPELSPSALPYLAGGGAQIAIPAPIHPCPLSSSPAEDLVGVQPKLLCMSSHPSGTLAPQVFGNWPSGPLGAAGPVSCPPPFGSRKSTLKLRDCVWELGKALSGEGSVGFGRNCSSAFQTRCRPLSSLGSRFYCVIVGEIPLLLFSKSFSMRRTLRFGWMGAGAPGGQPSPRRPSPCGWAPLFGCGRWKKDVDRRSLGRFRLAGKNDS